MKDRYILFEKDIEGNIFQIAEEDKKETVIELLNNLSETREDVTLFVSKVIFQKEI